ncbi:hypothetical protein SASPL_141374 [Salvia splendens]|uniref:Uncharacterized protein n=1 Tax=Salvia splendens TaxID=180675 RepID=A0A8X8WSD6_SALSN|nr:hypothetical protein SASPL_141374 [Salvia splendens]
MLCPKDLSSKNYQKHGTISSLRNIGQKAPFNGVLDNLPQTITKSPVMSAIMIERLGIRREYLSMEQGEAQGKNSCQGSRNILSQDQASQMSQKVVVRLLHNVGSESSSDTSLEVMAQFLSSHISKLGCTLKLLADSYRKQCSATELLTMTMSMARAPPVKVEGWVFFHEA